MHNDTSVKFAENCLAWVETILGDSLTTFNRQEDLKIKSNQTYVDQANIDYNAPIPLPNFEADGILSCALEQGLLGINRKAMLCNEFAGLIAYKMIAEQRPESFSLVIFPSSIPQRNGHTLVILGLDYSATTGRQGSTSDLIKQQNGLVLDFWNKENSIYPVSELVSNMQMLARQEQLKCDITRVALQLHIPSMHAWVETLPSTSPIFPIVEKIKSKSCPELSIDFLVSSMKNFSEKHAFILAVLVLLINATLIIRTSIEKISALKNGFFPMNGYPKKGDQPAAPTPG